MEAGPTPPGARALQGGQGRSLTSLLGPAPKQIFDIPGLSRAELDPKSDVSPLPPGLIGLRLPRVGTSGQAPEWAVRKGADPRLYRRKRS